MDESYELTEFNNPKLEFQIINRESLSNIATFIIKNLKSQVEIGDKINNLKESKAIKLSNFDDVMYLIEERLFKDYRQSIKETNKFAFNYFLTQNSVNDSTMTLYNKLMPNRTEFGILIYPILSIRKNEVLYFYWNHK